MCDKDKESVLNAFGSYERFKNHFKYFDNIFGITSYIINNAACGVKLNKNVLYLFFFFYCCHRIYFIFDLCFIFQDERLNNS